MEPITQVAAAEGTSEQECYAKYFDRVFRDTNAQSSIRTRVMEAVAGEGDFVSIEYVPKSGRNKGREVISTTKGAIAISSLGCETSPSRGARGFSKLDERLALTGRAFL